MIGENEIQNFEILHFRYLNFELRQFLWKGRLLDSAEFWKYQENMNSTSAILFKASPDEPLILADITRILNQTEWTGDLLKIVDAFDKNDLDWQNGSR